MKELFQCMIKHKDYATLYSSLVATGAFLFSIFSFVISSILSECRRKKEREVSNARYEEQKKQYDDRLADERIRREEDKKITDERARISEQPYLVFKKAEKIKAITSSSGTEIVFSMSFLNKGRGSAYGIVPDMNCTVSHHGNTFSVYRYDAIDDPIAMVNEYFVVEWCYLGKEVYEYRMPFSIRYEDASGRKYVQTYVVDVISENVANIINYSKPQLSND